MGNDYHSRDINFLSRQFSTSFLTQFVKTCRYQFQAENLNINDIELISQDKHNAILKLSNDIELKVQVNFPILTLDIPEFHPLLSYGINCPLSFLSNLDNQNGRYKTIVIDSNNIRKNDFKIVDNDRFYNDPLSLKKNIAILLFDTKFENSSPIYLSKILHNRLEKFKTYNGTDNGLIKPFYKQRKWKNFNQIEKQENNEIELKIISYNML